MSSYDLNFAILRYTRRNTPTNDALVLLTTDLLDFCRRHQIDFNQVLMQANARFISELQAKTVTMQNPVS